MPKQLLLETKKNRPGDLLCPTHLDDFLVKMWKILDHTKTWLNLVKGFPIKFMVNFLHHLGPFWTIRGNLRPYWTFWDPFVYPLGPFWPFWDHIWPFWTILDHCWYFWTILDHLIQCLSHSHLEPFGVIWSLLEPLGASWCDFFFVRRGCVIIFCPKKLCIFFCPFASSVRWP